MDIDKDTARKPDTDPGLKNTTIGATLHPAPIGVAKKEKFTTKKFFSLAALSQ